MQQQFRIDYEGYWKSGAFCDIKWYKEENKTIIIATDCSNEHQNTSITNRIERVMFLAWEILGKPTDAVFIEHYKDNPEEYDKVTFENWPMTKPCFCAGKVVGQEFETPNWSPIKDWKQKF